MNQVRIVPLDTTRHVDKTAIGPKALSFIRLGRIGITVPAGFCITAAAFREHLEQNNLLARLKAAVNELAKTEPQAKEEHLSLLRQAIVEAPLAETVRHEIEENYRKLGADYVAVRSSGTTAVVNVGGATKIIKTGQKIQVDGNRGVVRILQ